MKIYSKIIFPVVFAIFFSLNTFASDQADETVLKLPEGLSIEQKGNVEYEEFRSGGRLERLTIRRKNGLTETYQNQREDSLWNAEENELGEVKNIRRWTIGSW